MCIYCIPNQSVATTPPLEVLTSSSNGGSIESERGNVTFSCVTLPIALNMSDRTIYYYNSLEHVVYKRTLDINSQDEVSRTILLFVYSIYFIVVLLNWSLILIHLDLDMIRLHRHYTLLTELFKGKLIY